MSVDARVLVRYLAQIRVHRQSGALLIREGERGVQAYFREGFLVYAHPEGDPEDRAAASGSGARAARVQELLVSCFGMHAPECTFDPVTDRVGQVEELPSSVEPLVLRGVEAHYDEQSVGELLFGELDGYLALLVPAEQVVRRLQLDDDEAMFVAGIDGQETVRFVLANAPLDILLASQIVSALFLLDMAIAWTEPASLRPLPSFESDTPPRAPGPTTVVERPPVAAPRRPAPPTPRPAPPRPEPAKEPPRAGVRRPSPGLFEALRRTVGKHAEPSEREKHEVAMARAEAIRERFRNRPPVPPSGDTSGGGEDEAAEAARAFDSGKMRMNLGDFTAAAELFRRATELRPGDPRYHFYEAWAELQTVAEGPERDALKTELARQVKATLLRGEEQEAAFAHYVLGRLRIMDGDEERGGASLRRALRLDPSLLDAERHLRVLSMRRKK